MTHTRLLLALALVAAAVLVACGNKTYQTHYDPPIPFDPDSKPSVLPFDDEIKGGGFSKKCRADLAKPEEMCKEVMEIQKKRTQLIDSPAHAGEWCESRKYDDCFEGAQAGHLYVVEKEPK